MLIKKLEEELREEYGYKVSEISGYENLTEENKELFLQYVKNARKELRSIFTKKPVQVNFVTEIEYLKEKYIDEDGEQVYEMLGLVIYENKSSGEKEEIKRNFFTKGISEKDATCKTEKNYLRVEWEMDDKRVWCVWHHVIDPNTWY